jgi:L-ribulose-5-phosphate 3-epimerase
LKVQSKRKLVQYFWEVALIKIGMNGRFFLNNWRSAIEEIQFCKKVGFQSLQFQGKESSLNEADLGASFQEVARLLGESAVMPVMEILLRLDAEGLSGNGFRPIEVLQANIEAISRLKCQAVHWHLVMPPETDSALVERIELNLYPQFEEAIELATTWGFRFGIEHNEPEQKMFNNPESCAKVLEAIEGLGFVWDFNHTAIEQIAGYKQLIPRMTMLHVSDSPLPVTNYHLPIGLGNIDFSDYLCALIEGGFEGAAILEIGGLPKSGGYGRDTDEALESSLQQLKTAMLSC